MDILSKSSNFGLTQSLIDTLGFWAVNYIGHEVTDEIHKPKMDKLVIFLGSDLLIRNKLITYWKDKFVNDKGYESIDMTNAYISSTSFLFGTIYDIIRSKPPGAALANNLVSNALGLGTNIVIDNLMTDKKYA